MVGIVLVSHSATLAAGLLQLTEQVAGNQVKVAAAGGLNDNTLGTSAERIRQAIEQVYAPDGVLILFDLGSALMSTEMALHMLPPAKRKNIKLSNAPLVEGALAAVVEASLGSPLYQVNTAAEAVLAAPKLT